MLDIFDQSPKSPAHLLFQQCVAVTSKEGKSIDFIKNEISGYFLNEIDPIKLNDKVWKKTLHIMSLPEINTLPVNIDSVYKDLPIILQDFLLKKKVKWKTFSGVKVAHLYNSTENDKLELIHVMPGGSIPRHTHVGKENFLVLHGSYSDEYGEYYEGSVQTRDEDHDHKPVGNPTVGCIGLAYTDGKIKFSGRFSKVLNFFNN